MNSAEIKARLKEKGLTQADLCRRLGKSKAAIHYLVHRELRSAPLDRRLARILGVSLEELRGNDRETQPAA